MRVRYHRATGTVTGSKHELETTRPRILFNSAWDTAVRVHHGTPPTDDGVRGMHT